MTAPLQHWVDQLRPLVIAKKLPRKIMLQPLTLLGADGEVELKEYPVDLQGFISSHVERGL